LDVQSATSLYKKHAHNCKFRPTRPGTRSMSAPDAIAGRVRVNARAHPRLAAGHLWLYETDVDLIGGTPGPGDLVDVLSGPRLIGRGFFNPRSKIRVRMLASGDTAVDEAFWRERLRAATALRARVVAGSTAYRVVHGESDALPGLIVDRFGSLLVMQTLAAGMERRKTQLAAWLTEITGASTVYLRNDAKALAREGIPTETGFLTSSGPTEVDIVEGGARFQVDVAHGQKTGWYCDQRENRLAAARLARDLDVLDVCCHTGGFAIQAALGGARSVLGLDVSPDAVRRSRIHAAQNAVDDRCRFEEADAFDALRQESKAGRTYDLAILDPPAFARAKAAVPQALAGYKDLNLRAMKLLRPGGFLVTSSCSHYVEEGAFWDTVLAAARDARRPIRLLQRRGHAPDHPILGSMPETRYLKCFIVQMM
jgi:23S rRNA (cytosine1962-C5)-methyltransferase